MTNTTDAACIPYVNAGNDYWFEPSDREKGRGETRREQLDRVTMARAICHGCPLAATCLEVAVTRGFKAGIWGGTTGRQRQGMGTPREPAQCGTSSGYTAHRRRGEAACQPCKDAGARRSRELRAAKKKAA